MKKWRVGMKVETIKKKYLNEGISHVHTALCKLNDKTLCCNGSDENLLLQGCGIRTLASSGCSPAINQKLTLTRVNNAEFLTRFPGDETNLFYFLLRHRYHTLATVAEITSHKANRWQRARNTWVLSIYICFDGGKVNRRTDSIVTFSFCSSLKNVFQLFSILRFLLRV